MSDDGICIVFVFFQEFIGARKSNLVDVLFDLFCGHSDAIVRHCKRFLRLVDAYTNR